MRSSHVSFLALSPSVLLLAIGLTVAAPVITELQNAGKVGMKHSSAALAAHKMRKPTGKSAIIHTDNKLDDKGALTLLERTGDYDHMHIVLNGVPDTHKAHNDAVHYFRQMDEMNKAHGMKHPIKPKTFYRGGNPIKGKIMHEDLFAELPEGSSPGPIHDHKDIGKHLSKGNPSSVDIYHLAPTPHEELKRDALAAKENNIHVGTVMHVAGYNTRQSTESRISATDATMKHATRLSKMFSKHHPGSETIFTHSHLTFTKPGGGTQPYEWAKHRFPKSALDMATEKEPFHQIQLEASSKKLREEGLSPKQYPHEDDKEKQQKALWKARMSKKGDESTKHLRHQFLEPGEENLKMLKDSVGEKHYNTYRLSSALHGISEDCQVELCDMTHIGALMKARKRKAEGHDSFRPIHAYRSDTGTLLFREAGPGDEHHAITPMGLDKEEVTAHIEPYFPPVHGHGDKGASSSGTGEAVP